MRWIMLPGMLSLSLLCFAQEPAIEVGGLEITRGMQKEEILSAFSPDHINCSTPDRDEDCAIGDASALAVHGGTAKFTGEGEIVFEDGRVWSASRNRLISDSAEAYDMFLQLYEVLLELTGGSETCAMVYTYLNPGLKHMYLVLPEKIIEIGAGSHGPGRRTAFIRERLRINPVPKSKKVQKLNTERLQCAFVE